MEERHQLHRATASLPPAISRWMRAALGCGSFRLGPGSYENDLTVCPIVAAAKLAGVWHDRAMLDGHPEWGTPDGPSEAVEDFAAYFDWCCESLGVDAALKVVQQALCSASGASTGLAA